MKNFYEMLRLLEAGWDGGYDGRYDHPPEEWDHEDDDGDRDDGPEPPSEADLKSQRDAEYKWELEQERKRLYPHEGKYDQKWDRGVGKTPNGKRYNLIVRIYAKNEDIARSRVWSFEDSHWGAKHILDIRRSKSDNPDFPVLYKMYVRDNHAEGNWVPFKGEPYPADERDHSPPSAFDIHMAKEKGYEPKGMPISIPPVLDEE